MIKAKKNINKKVETLDSFLENLRRKELDGTVIPVVIIDDIINIDLLKSVEDIMNKRENIAIG